MATTNCWPESICPGCRALDPPCEWVELGVGAYEYWGATGFDSHLVWVTRCCEAVPEEFWPDPVEPNDNEIYEHELV
jgi:hypothetical protein